MLTFSTLDENMKKYGNKRDEHSTCSSFCSSCFFLFWFVFVRRKAWNVFMREKERRVKCNHMREKEKSDMDSHMHFFFPPPQSPPNGHTWMVYKPSNLLTISIDLGSHEGTPSQFPCVLLHYPLSCGVLIRCLMV